MTSTTASLEQLLWRSEGETLDFKRDTYRIELASDDEKAEFVKDVLAMANAWRSELAFILVGVDETAAPGPARVVGAAQFPDDAKLQQLVNGKTNRPLTFSCEVLSFQGKQVGVVRIPCQQRPFFLKKDYGKLKSGAVYVRRGSSTDVADADEIARMGAANALEGSPAFDVQFADPMSQQPCGRRLLIESVLLDDPPDEVLEPFRPAPHDPLSFADFDVNANYHEHLLRYAQTTRLMRPFRLIIQNLSGRMANGVRVQFDLDGSGILAKAYLPPRPLQTRMGMIPVAANITTETDIDVERLGGRLRLVFHAQEVQPKASVVSSVFFVGTRHDGVETFQGTIFSNEGEPQGVELAFERHVSRRTATRDDLLAARRRGAGVGIPDDRDDELEDENEAY